MMMTGLRVTGHFPTSFMVFLRLVLACTNYNKSYQINPISGDFASDPAVWYHTEGRRTVGKLREKEREN